MRRRAYPTLSAYLAGEGLNQTELAHKLGMSPAFISRLVRNIQQPSLDEALRISRITNVPVESFVSDDNSLTIR